MRLYNVICKWFEKNFSNYRTAKEAFGVHDQEAEIDDKDLDHVVEIGGIDREAEIDDLGQEVGIVVRDLEVEIGVRDLDLVIVAKNILQVLLRNLNFNII